MCYYKREGSHTKHKWWLMCTPNREVYMGHTRVQ